jgi:hypothetical protein
MIKFTKSNKFTTLLMLYLPIKKTKKYLIVFSALFILHLSFFATETYTTNVRNGPVLYFTEENYQNFLNLYSLTNSADQVSFIKNTKLRYLYVLPKFSILFIYLGYFIMATLFILSIKCNLNEVENEHQ